MGDKLRRVKCVAAGMLAIALAGGATVTSGQSASASTPAQSTGAVKAAPLKPGTFRVASFNVLGASHTKHGKRAYGTTRIVWANQLLDQHGIQVAGFQELQAVQLAKLKKITNGAWQFYPDTTLGNLNSENSVGWRTKKFSFVQATTVTIPYFNGGPRKMPVVLLRDKRSGMLTWFSNFHNAAETKQYKNQGKWRVKATRIEMALQTQLAKTGIPRIMTGDMNERAEYFCRVTNGIKLKAARPNTYRRGGKCYANKPRAVDWILGSRRAVFTRYVEDRSDLVDKTTDHPVVVSTVTVDPTRLPAGWNTTDPALFTPAVSYRR